MELADKLELHYYFNDDSHDIDAILRNKCEAEIIAITLEAANILQIPIHLTSGVNLEGGFRDFWKVLGENNNQVTILLVVLTIVLSRIPLQNSEPDVLEQEIKRLTIEEKKLTIEKLKQELSKGEFNLETIRKAAKSVNSSLKVIKRKSNFYNHLSKSSKVTQVGFNSVSRNYQPISDEMKVISSEFNRFILNTNKLGSEEDDDAIIQIVSPVLREGRYKWKGIYNEEPISFDMYDFDFKEQVLLEKYSFKHGSSIRCVLKIQRELDEIGDIKIKGYTVDTVLEKIDDHESIYTLQGKRYKQAQKFERSQGDMFS